MDPLLLGGWQDVVDDTALLERGLAHLPETCACHQGSAHLSGGCACCQAGERQLDDPCIDCEKLLARVGEQIDELADASLRFLPFVESSTHSKIDQGISIAAVRQDISRVASTFLQLETGAGEFRIGCGTTHLASIKRLARQLAEEVRTVDDGLRALTAHASYVPKSHPK